MKVSPQTFLCLSYCFSFHTNPIFNGAIIEQPGEEGRQWNRGGRITIILRSMCFLIRAIRCVSNLGLYYQSFFICLFFLFRRRQRWLVCLKRTPLPQMRANSLTTHGEELRFFFFLSQLYLDPGWSRRRPLWMRQIEQFSIEDRKDRIALALLCSVIALRNTYHPLS